MLYCGAGHRWTSLFVLQTSFTVWSSHPLESYNSKEKCLENREQCCFGLSLTWISIDEESLSASPSIGVKYKCRHPQFPIFNYWCRTGYLFRHWGVESSAFVQVVEKFNTMLLKIGEPIKNIFAYSWTSKKFITSHCPGKTAIAIALPWNIYQEIYRETEKVFFAAKTISSWGQNAKSHEQVAARVDSQDINIAMLFQSDKSLIKEHRPAKLCWL